jgi:hydroxypyruvate reductase
MRDAFARGVLPELGSPAPIVAAGKASWRMAQAIGECAPGSQAHGLIAGPRVGSTAPPSGFEWYEAGHPYPNDASVAAGRHALRLAAECRQRSGTLVVLLSGGASAMLASPAAGLTIEDKQATGRAVMQAGFAIDRLNCVRKHLSEIKGGGLAAAAGRVVTLVISDVHGPVPNDPSVIGSGPTVPDPTSFQEALEIVRQVPGVPNRVRQHLERGAQGELPETLKQGDRRLVEWKYDIIGDRTTALEGARLAAESLKYRVAVFEEATSGEARDAARDFVKRATRAAEGGRRVCVVAAGETTVTVTGNGTGGRNQEFVLAAVPALAALERDAVLASLGTDGVDGPTDAGGAIADPNTLARARDAQLDWYSTLTNNDAYHFFEPLGDLIAWGPTGTNVGDVQVLLIE